MVARLIRIKLESFMRIWHKAFKLALVTDKQNGQHSLKIRPTRLANDCFSEKFSLYIFALVFPQPGSEYGHFSSGAAVRHLRKTSCSLRSSETSTELVRNSIF